MTTKKIIKNKLGRSSKHQKPGMLIKPIAPDEIELVIKNVQEFSKEYIWPEDYWLAVKDDLDVNIFTSKLPDSDLEKKGVTIYRVNSTGEVILEPKECYAYKPVDLELTKIL